METGKNSLSIFLPPSGFDTMPGAASISVFFFSVSLLRFLRLFAANPISYFKISVFQLFAL